MNINIPKVTGNIVITGTALMTDLLHTAIDTNGNVYNGKGWKSGLRLNSSGVEVSRSDQSITGFVACDLSKKYVISGFHTYGSGMDRVQFFDTDKNFVGDVYGLRNDGSTATWDETNNLLTAITTPSTSTVKYFRLCCATIDDNATIKPFNA